MAVRFLPVGDSAVSVQLGEDISLETNRKVIMLMRALEENPVEGVTECIPAYATVMIHYRPDVILFDRLKERVEELLGGGREPAMRESFVTEIPVLYGGTLGEDLSVCASLEGVSEEELINSSPLWRRRL